MKQTVKCLPCYLNAAINCMERAGFDRTRQYELCYQLLPELKAQPLSGTPCENASRFLRAAYEKMGVSDPFEREKRLSNELALGLLPRLREILDSSSDRLHMALRLAAAGNIIDLAIFDSVDVLPAIDHCVNHDFSLSDYPLFREQLVPAKEVLICGDNAGEIVFDTLLVRELQALGKSVTYMVKSGPIMNDATLADAEQAGMTELCPVVTIGMAEMGFNRNNAAPETLAHFERADLIIAKGQANFEGLDDAPFAGGKIFFLLKLKCSAICQYVGAELSDVIFLHKK